MSELMSKNITIGDKYGPAMKITGSEEAKAYFERCVEHTMSHGKTRVEAESCERDNLAYYAGYYSHETRVHVECLFDCCHPVFGAAS